MLNKDEKTMPLSEIVPEYDSSCFIVRDYFWDRIKYPVKFGNVTDDKSILDVGCGIGHLLREIRKSNKKCKLVGIDFNINVKDLSIENCSLMVEDARNMPFGDNSFDIVYALDSLEHIENADKAIREIRRVLKPGGSFIITGPTESGIYKLCRFILKGTFSEKEGPGTGVHYHNVDGLDKEIMNHGFVKEKNMNLPRRLPFALVKIIKYRNKK